MPYGTQHSWVTSSYTAGSMMNTAIIIIYHVKLDQNLKVTKSKKYIFHVSMLYMGQSIQEWTK